MNQPNRAWEWMKRKRVPIGEWIDDRSVVLVLGAGLAAVAIGFMCVPTLSRWLGYDSQSIDVDRTGLRLNLAEIIVEAVGFSVAILTAWLAWREARREPKLALSFEEDRDVRTLDLDHYDRDRRVLWLRNTGSLTAKQVMVRLRTGARMENFLLVSSADKWHYLDPRYDVDESPFVDTLNENAPGGAPWGIISGPRQVRPPQAQWAANVFEFRASDDFVVYPSSTEPITSSFPTVCHPNKGRPRSEDITVRFDYEIIADRLKRPARGTISIRGNIEAARLSETPGSRAPESLEMADDVPQESKPTRQLA